MGHPRLPIVSRASDALPQTVPVEAFDPFGRRIDYLRISITDRCNLRCVYCMPAEGVVLQPREQLLTHGEIVRVAEAAHALGFRKFRVTGGEPLVVRGLLNLLRTLRQVTPGALLCLTTNGVHLADKAASIHAVGVQRLNISIDTLRPERFSALSRRDLLSATWKGIEAALQAGFDRVKLNTVLVPGINEDELLDLAALADRWPVDVRFIEQMPLDNQFDGGFLGADTIAARLRAAYPELQPLPLDEPEAATQMLFASPRWRGRVGLIAPRSHKFCASCNRLRLTSNGELKGCLLRQGSLDVRTPLRAGVDDAQVRSLVQQAIGAKPLEYRDESYGLDRPMSALGG